MPKPFYEYWVSLMPQSELGVKVHKMFGTQDTRELPAPAVTKEYPKQQQSYETSDSVPLESFGETLRAPLGYIVAGRVRNLTMRTWNI